MQKTLSYLLPLLILLPVSPSLFGHVSFNLAVDEHGNIYFLDVFKNTLVRVTSEGEVSVLADLRVVEPEKRLHSMAIGEKGDLYVGGYHRQRIWRFSPTGEVLPVYPMKGSESTSSGVLHLGFDAAGRLYVMDWYYGAARRAQRFRILRFHDPEKTPTDLFVSHGGEDGFLDFHTGSMLVAGDGTVYLSNAHRIWKLGSDRRLVLVAGSPDKGFVDGIGNAARFESPYGMCVDRDGSILVAERSGRIRRVDAKGGVTTVTGTQSQGYKDGALKEAEFGQAFGVGVGPKGRVYVAEYQEKREYRIRVISEGRVATLARIPSDGVFAK